MLTRKYVTMLTGTWVRGHYLTQDLKVGCRFCLKTIHNNTSNIWAKKIKALQKHHLFTEERIHSCHFVINKHNIKSVCENSISFPKNATQFVYFIVMYFVRICVRFGKSSQELSG